MPRCICVAGLCLLVTASLGCAEHRDFAADSQGPATLQTALASTGGLSEAEAAREQAVESAVPGDRQQVRDEARQAASTLKGLVAIVLQIPNANPRVVAGLTRDVTELSSGLDAIADSRGDEEFTSAVFSMCDPEPIQASNRVGPLLVALAARLRANPPARAPADQVDSWARYFDTLGETLVRIPRQCRRAHEEVAGAKVQLRMDDPADPDQVPAARLRARRRRVATSMLDCLAAGMVAPSPNRYQLGTVSRLGYAVQLCQP
jgi:hypothetical protein